MKPEMIQAGPHRFEVFTDGDQKSKKLALFLHGFPDVAQTWDAQISGFVEKGYKVWAPNLRGYGNSYSPLDVASYHPKLLVEDVAQIMDAAGCDDVTLIGHDWGAVIAWYFALEDKRPIQKLIIMNVPHPYVSAKEFRKWRQLKRSWYMFAFQIPWLPEKLIANDEAKDFVNAIRNSHTKRESFTDEMQQLMKDNLLRPKGVTPLLNWYRAAFRNRAYMADLYKKRKKIDVPTLMIWGEKDTAIGIYNTFGTEKHVNDFTIRYLKDAGHFVQHDAADQVNDITHAWLDGKKVPGQETPENPY